MSPLQCIMKAGSPEAWQMLSERGPIKRHASERARMRGVRWAVHSTFFPLQSRAWGLQVQRRTILARLKQRKDELKGNEIEAASQIYFSSLISPPIANNALVFRVQEHMTTVRRRRGSRSNAPRMEIAVGTKSETISRIVLHSASSYWSDITAEMASFYKQNFKHLIPINYKESAKYSAVKQERSSKVKTDPVEAQHHEWRSQQFEELPAWRQGRF